MADRRGRLVLPGGETRGGAGRRESFGDVVDPDTGSRLAGPEARDGRFLTARALVGDTLLESPLAAANSTLVCVATDVACDQASLKRVVIEAHDGLARAVRPAHTVVDGDIAFALAPAGPKPSLMMRLRLGAASAEAVSRAIVNAVGH